MRAQVRAISLSGLPDLRKVTEPKAPKPTVTERFFELAREYAGLVRLAKELRASRAARRCEYQDEETPPCWHSMQQNLYDEDADWPCQPCKERIPIHAAYRNVSKRRGSVLSRLVRLSAQLDER